MTASDRDQPPLLAARLAAVRLPHDRREFVVGDLEEEFQHRARTHGRGDAVRWYWKQALRIAAGRHPQILLPDHTPRRRTGRFLLDVSQDVSYAIRGLRRSPSFAAASVLTLALGVGADAAVFRVAWHVVLKPLPYADADRIVRVWEEYTRRGAAVTNTVAPGNFVDWQRDTHVFEAFAAHSALRSTLDLTGAGEPVELEVRYVSPSYFSVFSTTPLAGRTFAENEPAAGAVISESLWRARFGGDSRVLGRTIELSGEPYTIVGVMPASFGTSAGSSVEAWLPITLTPQGRVNHGAHYLGIVAKLKPGVTMAGAIADVKAAARLDSVAFPTTNKDTSATVTSLETERGGTLRDALALLAVAAAFVLLIACANLASLQLARGLSRAREFGIRTALGASRGRLIRQCLVESVVVATIGAAAGIALSSWLLAAMAAVAPQAVRAGVEAGLDGTAIVSAGVLAMVSVGLFASWPAWSAAGRASRWLSQRAGTADGKTSSGRTVLVTGQLSLAMTLLVSTILLVTSLARVLHVDPGFEASGLLAFDVSQPWSKYSTLDRRRQLFSDVFRELSAVPGVTGTCGINVIPFDETFNMTYVPEGQTAPVSAYARTITAGCFDVLRVTLFAGRAFTDHESSRAGIVTRAFAQRAWGAENAVGRRVHVGVAGGALVDIVGVVSDSLQTSLEGRTYPQFYETTATTGTFPAESILVRTSTPPGALFNAVRAAVRRVDPDQTVARLRTVDQIVAGSMSEREFNLGLLGGFATIALVLAAVGIYGLFSQVVAERRPEIGIRIALGADPAGVVRLVLRRAWLAIAVGLAVGTAGTYAASGVLGRLLFQLSATDPRVYAGSAAVLTAIALAAAWLPSRHAARVDPISVLRDSA